VCFNAFIYSIAIQNIGMMESGTKPAITPTYMKNIRPLKIAYTVKQAKGRGGWYYLLLICTETIAFSFQIAKTYLKENNVIFR